jgi:hypothetical protein
MHIVSGRMAAVVVLGLGAVAVASPASAVVLPPTQAEAQKVADDYVTVNAQNNATLNVEAQDAIEDAPIKPIDDALFREFQGRGKTTLGEKVMIDSMKVYRPDQSSFPLKFLALQRAHDPQGKTRQFLIFEKASETDAWKVSTAAQLLDNAPTPKLKVNSDGFVNVITPGVAKGLAVKPDSLASKLAKVWDKSVNGVAASNDFDSGPLTTDAASVFVGALQQLPIGKAAVDFSFTPGENQPVCFAETRGGALCFFVISFTETLRPSNGSFVQPPTREPLTGLVPPGSYSRVKFERSAILLANVPKRGKLARAKVIGIYEGVVTATATPGTGQPQGTPA